MSQLSGMDEIVPGLWVGDWQAAKSSWSMTAITVACDSPHVGADHFPLIDGPGNEPEVFLNAVSCVCEAMRGGSHVIVHCVAGRSRSCAVVVGALMQAKGLNLCEAYDLVKAKRPTTQIHPAFARLMEMVEAA